MAPRRSTRISVKAAAAPAAEVKKAAPKKAAPKKATVVVKIASAIKKAVATKANTKKAPAAAKPASKKEAADSKGKSATATPSSTKASNDKKTIVTVKACKQWGAFKTRANKIIKAVGDRAIVEVNKEKPDKGDFVVIVQGIDKPIVSLLGMKRPFSDLKALDMDEINKKILEALK